MKALVFHKPKDVRVDTVNDPKIEHEQDAIIRVTSTAICGSDLHIYNGMVPQPRPMVLGHEFMGIVEELGAGVTNLRIGDPIGLSFRFLFHAVNAISVICSSPYIAKDRMRRLTARGRDHKRQGSGSGSLRLYRHLRRCRRRSGGICESKIRSL